METESMLGLANEFALLTDQIRGDGSANGVWHRVTELATQHVPGCAWVSVSEITSKHARSQIVSDPIAGYIDTLQYEAGQGPCLQAAFEKATVHAPDLAQENRWPRFVAAARSQTQLAGALAIGLPGRSNSAINFYATVPSVFDDPAIAAASIFSAQAATVLAVGAETEQRANLQDALHSNRQIGMAMGVLMAHYRVTENEAFTLLRVASQGLHRKLRDVALQVLETGELPDLPQRTSAAPAREQ